MIVFSFKLSRVNNDLKLQRLIFITNILLRAYKSIDFLN